jgi:hypothetical protein
MFTDSLVHVSLTLEFVDVGVFVEAAFVTDDFC